MPCLKHIVTSLRAHTKMVLCGPRRLLPLLRISLNPKECEASEEEFYLYERPWSMILGTPVKAWDNRLPFMMLPQHPNAYYAAMCLYNMVNNEKEMKKHKIPKITYGKESC